MQICTDTPIPDFVTMYDSFSANLTFPPQNFAFPKLPTLPSPMFPSINAPNLEMVTTLLEVQANQMMMTMMAFIQPVIDALSLVLDDVLPKMVGLPDFNLISLLESKADELYAAVKDMIPSLSFRDFYLKLNIPDMQLMQKATELVKTYVATLVTWLEDKISAVTDLLELISMPKLPTIPTMEELRALAKSRWDEMYAAYEDLVSKIPSGEEIPEFDYEAMITSVFDFEIPGFPKLPKLPTPLIPSINIPEFNFELALQQQFAGLTSYAMSLVMDFVDDVLSTVLTFEFPTICVTVGAEYA